MNNNEKMISYQHITELMEACIRSGAIKLDPQRFWMTKFCGESTTLTDLYLDMSNMAEQITPMTFEELMKDFMERRSQLETKIEEE